MTGRRSPSHAYFALHTLLGYPRVRVYDGSFAECANSLSSMDRTGYCLIETMLVREERILFLERHLARLECSIGELGLPKPCQDAAALVRPFAATGAGHRADRVARRSARARRSAHRRTGSALLA